MSALSPANTVTGPECDHLARQAADDVRPPEKPYSKLPPIDLVRNLWCGVLAARAPQVLDWAENPDSLRIPPGDEAIPFLQALNIWFQLLRIVDENTAIRDRRSIETTVGEKAVAGSFAQVLSDSSLDRDSFRSLLCELEIGPTLTAHPTEAKRVTVLQIHRRIYRHLVALETDRWTPREQAAIHEDIAGEIDLLWMTGELRLERPSLKDEIEWGLQFFRNSLFDAVPQMLGQLQRAAETIFDDHAPVPTCVRLHNWIGGDRDGNPSVTSEQTRHALERGQETVLSMYCEALDDAAARISISERIQLTAEPHQARLRAIVAGTPVAQRNPNELFRQVLSAMGWRLRNERYKHVAGFVADLDSVHAALSAVGAERLARRFIQPLRWQAGSFGFRTATLDIRQNSTVTTAVLAEIWALRGDTVPEYGTAQWSERLRGDLVDPDLTAVDSARLGEDAAELIALLSLMQAVRHQPDPDAIGPFILSMTRSADDLLGVFALARHAGFGAETLDLAVVPLFETIDDLRSAPDILAGLLDVPLARRSLKAHGRSLEIMLGYSDSNKDGGFVCSIRELDSAQRRIVRVLDSRGFRAAFFHGRGGSVSRGGAPTERAIAAQPPGTIRARLRVTDQGEVVSARYANRGTAANHLELLAASTLCHSVDNRDEPIRPEFEDMLDALAGLSQTAYVTFLNTPGFVDYFRQASPVEELAQLKIGSRPAKRFGAAALADLRAIPWVFAWSQNRHLITGWYGFGTAIESLCRVRGAQGKEMLHTMFEHSRLFRLMVDEIEKSLSRSDMTIAAEYATLVVDSETRDTILTLVQAEYRRACAGVRLVTSVDEIGARFPHFHEQFQRVRTDLDRINALQVDLLREYRAGNVERDVPTPLLQSMNSIAAGLGWTG